MIRAIAGVIDAILKVSNINSALRKCGIAKDNIFLKSHIVLLRMDGASSLNDY